MELYFVVLSTQVVVLFVEALSGMTRLFFGAFLLLQYTLSCELPTDLLALVEEAHVLCPAHRRRSMQSRRGEL